MTHTYSRNQDISNDETQKKNFASPAASEIKSHLNEIKLLALRWVIPLIPKSRLIADVTTH
ncbi:hypothetical protein [Sedimentitalea nanhaiensis]|uniref:hypothetical protein n=1 Tax=Sedimentitalea nanhaiensis TaxID=999627 RepID=UPI001113471B|nr:hypothetical protein [Sedimentitalea nanhaiensis]